MHTTLVNYSPPRFTPPSSHHIETMDKSALQPIQANPFGQKARNLFQQTKSLITFLQPVHQPRKLKAKRHKANATQNLLLQLLSSYQFVSELARYSHHSDFINLLLASKSVYHTISQTANIQSLIPRMCLSPKIFCEKCLHVQICNVLLCNVHANDSPVQSHLIHLKRDRCQ